MRELGLVDLTSEQRHAVTLMALARYAGQTPGELARVVARLVLTVDLAAAQARRDRATLGRRVDLRADTDGQAILSARGPIETIAAIKARLSAELNDQQLDVDDPRTRDQREFDLLADLLTSGTVDGQPVVDYSVAVIVPFSTADGGDLELGEIPGLGPILPATARDLFRQADHLTQVVVDDRGCVLAVSDLFAGRLRAAREAFNAFNSFNSFDATTLTRSTGSPPRQADQLRRRAHRRRTPLDNPRRLAVPPKAQGLLTLPSGRPPNRPPRRHR